MNNNLGNKESFQALDWVIEDAERGFFFVLASHKMQERIAKVYTTNDIAKLNYSDSVQYSDLRPYDKKNIEHYNPRVLEKFANEHADKQIFFVLNFQIPFSSIEDFLSLNDSKADIVSKNKIWVFFMTTELENRLYLSASDFHTHCNLKLEFEDFGIDETKSGLLDFSDKVFTLQQINEIEERLAHYKEEEKEFLPYFETTSEGMQLIRNGVSDNQLLAITGTLATMAELYDKIGDCENAIKAYEKVLVAREKILGLQHIDTAISYNNIGLIYENAGNYDKALEYHNKALEIQKQIVGLQHPDTTKSYNYIGVIYYKTGDYNKALKYFCSALEIRKKILGMQHIDTAESYNYIGTVYNNISDYSKALKYLCTALEIREESLGIQYRETTVSYNNIGTVYSNIGDYSKALTYLGTALKIREKILGTQHPDTAYSCNDIGDVYKKLGNYNKALEYYNKALTINEIVLGKEHPRTKNILENIEVCLQK